ncbi:cysteine desulfurase family protein [Corynebacterium sp.]|uniref:cysteine desulfurase family protein n=1 Tax=Corynebacterium sp. TaxID=1720 RepID=UPI002A90DD03|nr:cysteine desulfurase family protein [Corynebacterium sp.]MDY5784609.1 cysteine desulfurase family protein [Corynebacterium sp.]
MLYLDAAATAPLRPEAREAMLRVWDTAHANPSSVHSPGHNAAREVDHARSVIAEVFGIRPEGVVFTSGGTEANNLGIIGRALAHPRGRHVITSPIEHSSVLASCDYLRRLHGFEVDYLSVDGEGRVDYSSMPTTIREDTTLVAVGLANSEVGSVNDVSRISHLARDKGAGMHVDAVQAAVHLPVTLAPDGWPGPVADTLALASHKFGGPQGVGALLMPRHINLEPVLHGGSQEQGRRSGTHNVAGIAGFAAAVAASAQAVGARAAALMASRDELIAAIESGVPGAQLTGHRTERLPNHASFVVDGVSGESLLVALDTAGFAVSSGSACKAGSSEPSAVLLAMGYSPEFALSALRFTLSQPLDSATNDRIVDTIRREVALRE